MLLDTESLQVQNKSTELLGFDTLRCLIWSNNECTLAGASVPTFKHTYIHVAIIVHALKFYTCTFPSPRIGLDLARLEQSIYFGVGIP